MKNLNKIKCPCCSWTGSFKFSTHIINSNDNDHVNWINNIKKLYEVHKSSNKISNLQEIKVHNISKTVIKNILKKINILKKNTITKYKCPVCNFCEKIHLSTHIIENNDLIHTKLKNDIKTKYLDKKMSPIMISKQYNISSSSIKKILKNMNISHRTHHESVINAIKQNRHNISTYGIGGFRKDLNGHYRSIPEANFARVLKYENIEFEREVPFNLYDENNNVISTYFLDFLINKNQGIEIKGFERNGDFKNRQKIILFTKQYKNITLKVIFCSSKEWKDIQNKYSKLIPLWEKRSKNILNSELYK